MFKIDKQVAFNKIDDCLMNENTPSLKLNVFELQTWFHDYPFSMLAELKKTNQSPIHHPEGNVWNHTLLVVDEAARFKKYSINSKAFMWAALLHDIGKPKTTKKRKGKITAYNHDIIGADLAHEFLTYLACEPDFIQQVSQLIRYHMQILYVVKNLSFQDIPNMNKFGNIKDIALLAYCDRIGRLNVNKNIEKNNILLFLDKCGESTDIEWLKEE